MPKILLTNYYNAGPLKLVKELVPEGFDLIALEDPGQEAVIRNVSEAEYLLVGGRTRIDGRVLASAPKLKMIHRSGVGLDSLDLNAIRERNIPLYVNPGVNSRSVAEHTVMLILGTLRRVAVADAATKAGRWVKHELGISCHDLYGKQIGLIGLGSIGRYVVQMLKGFSADVVYTKRQALGAEEEESLGIRSVSLSDLLSDSDVISLHCSLNADTKNLLGAEQFSLMKPGAILINTSRGAIVDEKCLIDSLASGRLRGAGLDVFQKEPLAYGHPLSKQDNVLLTPHTGGITAETFESMISKAFHNILLYEKNQRAEIQAERVL